jgi:hypothetical protein
MKSRILGVALAASVLQVSSTAQTLGAPGATMGPSSSDFYFHENEDGSVVTADSNGTYYFASWSDYVQSPFFQDHGLFCGTDRLSYPMAFGTTGDCSSSNTNPAAEYEPAGGTTYSIPVVFHVLRRSNGAGDVSDALLNSQIDILNEDYRAMVGQSNGTPQIGVDARIEFTLAGITRSNSNAWYNDSGTYYNTLAWDTTRYLNIYTNQAGGNLGYAYVPSGGGVVGQTWDRVVLNWRYVGRNAPGGAPYDQGRTATHEVGHYLGLYHTFQGGCATASMPGCYTSGDLICETNSESSAFFGCGNRTTCGSPDPTDNYMDYTDDLCMNRFTAEQANRMRCTLSNFRVDLGDTGPTLPGAASSPSPGNGSSAVSVSANLSWSAGSGADSHDVYFGTSPSPGAGEFQGNQAGTSFDPGALANSTTYYWRIDEVNTAGTTTGAVWSFTTEGSGGGLPGQASNPSPSDGQRRVSTNTNLSWTAGSGATSHVVHFGLTDPPPAVGSQAGTTYDPGNLNGRTWYYWRIDEVNASGTTTGVVWRFRTR